MCKQAASWHGVSCTARVSRQRPGVLYTQSAAQRGSMCTQAASWHAAP
jgi:hypothetical protein